MTFDIIIITSLLQFTVGHMPPPMYFLPRLWLVASILCQQSCLVYQRQNCIELDEILKNVGWIFRVTRLKCLGVYKRNIVHYWQHVQISDIPWIVNVQIMITYEIKWIYKWLGFYLRRSRLSVHHPSTSSRTTTFQVKISTEWRFFLGEPVIWDLRCNIFRI